MLFWPRPSERLSSVDFTGFTVQGLGEGRSALCGSRMAGEAGGSGARAKQVQHNTVKPIPAPLFPDERGLTWQGVPPCNWAMLERWRPTCATRSGRTIVWICQHEMSVKSHQTEGSVTADRRVDESGGEMERWRDKRGGRGGGVRERHWLSKWKTVINKVHYWHSTDVLLK